MDTTINEKKDNTELMESIQDSVQLVKSSPAEEYSKAMKKRRSITFLFILFLMIEFAIGVFFVEGLYKFDLHYRVTREIENSFTGQNRFSTGIYTGETDFGYFLGDATFEYATGSTYEGQWNDNYMHGIGVLNIPSEGTYEGGFAFSQKSGQGTFTWDDGAVYTGEWKNDQMAGQGIYTSPEKVKYIGTFEDNRFKSGDCTFSNTTGTYAAMYKEFEIDNLVITFTDGSTYNGSTDGKALSGTGAIHFSNNDNYTGTFKNGSRTGNGVYTWSNGDVYDGSWSNDAMDGSGSYTYADGSCAEGKFDQNQFIDGSYSVLNNFGEYTFTIENSEAVAIKMVLTNGTTYSGDMKDGKLTGTAQISYSNGDKYSGRVNDGYKSGQGTYTWKSGASYEGDWSEDKMHGQGTYFYPNSDDGYKLTGKFEKGLPNGQCQYYTTSSKSYKTDWTNGRCVKVYE